ncbi:hypothetical protein BGZ75_009245 [Mortierella antarctica]|nr:hypothetical protein BGZ75_009245 [Mortierella antarctica]
MTAQLATIEKLQRLAFENQLGLCQHDLLQHQQHIVLSEPSAMPQLGQGALPQLPGTPLLSENNRHQPPGTPPLSQNNRHQPPDMPQLDQGALPQAPDIPQLDQGTPSQLPQLPPQPQPQPACWKVNYTLIPDRGALTIKEAVWEYYGPMAALKHNDVIRKQKGGLLSAGAGSSV